MRRVRRAMDATVYPGAVGPLRRATVGVAAALGLSFSAAAQQVPLDRLVAVVEQRALTASDLRLATRLGSIPGGAADEGALVDQLVTRELIRLEADRFAIIEPPAAEVEARLTVLAAGRDREAWLQELAALGVSVDRVRRTVADDLRIAAYIDQRFTTAAQPTDAESAERAAATGGTSAEAIAEARRALVATRRQTLIDDWVASLRRRSAVRVVARP